MNFSFLSLDFIAVLSGFGVGAIVGITGVGGGSLMTPLLLTVFKQNPVVAIGTDLWFAAITKTSGSIAHHRHGHVNYRVLCYLLAGSIPATVLTLYVMHSTGLNKNWSSTLTFSLGIALLITAATVAFKNVWLSVGLYLERLIAQRYKPALTCLCGVMLGVLVTLTSIGAGALGATLILLLNPRMQTRHIVGTDIAHAVPLTFVAGIGHAMMGNINWGLLAALLVGSIPGIWIGAQLTRKMPDGLIRTLLCASLVAAGVKVI
jgi:uncharacterized protein